MLVDGKKIAKKIEKRLMRKIRQLGTSPHLAVILVGDNPASPGAGRYLASKVYIGKKREAAERVGIKFSLFEISRNDPKTQTEVSARSADSPTPQEKPFGFRNFQPEGLGNAGFSSAGLGTEEDAVNLIKELNFDPKINGIIVQLPLPNGLDEEKILAMIDPSKDVDGVTLGSRFIPATAGAVLEVLERQKAKVKGANAVVVGRGRVAGLPIALELLKQDATLTLCHSKTRNLDQYTKNADILVSAVGKPGIIKPAMVKKRAIVIDVGISRVSKNSKFSKDSKVSNSGKGRVRLVGDVDPKVEKKAIFLTPVPGGVGPITVAKLLENTLMAYQIQQNVP